MLVEKINKLQTLNILIGISSSLANHYIHKLKVNKTLIITSIKAINK